MRVLTAVLATACIISALVSVGHCNESLSLQQAVDIALRQNPGLLAARSEVDAGQANERGARARSNPEVVVAPTVAGESGSDSAVSVIQPLEVNGQRTARSRVARYEAQASQSAYLAARREVVRDVKQAYWDVTQAANMVALSKVNTEFANTLYEATKKQLDVGASPGAEAIKAQVELARANQDLARAESDLSRAKAVLNTLLGRAPQTPFQLSDELSFTPLDIRTVKADDIRRPELAEAQALLNARKAGVREVEARRLPDLVLQARQEEFGGYSGVAVGVTIPLLDWGSVRADRKRAEAEVEAQSRRMESVRNAIKLDVDSALREVNRTEALIREYQNGVVSQAERLSEMAHKGYKAGANSYLEVLEAQRTLRSVKTEYYAALADHNKALAQLEWATGADAPKEVAL